MADRQWLSTADGNLTNTANWSGGALPVDGDRIFFNTGSVSVTSNHSGLSAIAAAELIFTEGWTGSLGDSSNFVVLEPPTGEVQFSSGGAECWLELAGGTATTVPRVEVSGGRAGANMLQIKATGTGKITTLTIGQAGGTVTVGNSTDLTNLYVTSPATNAVVSLGTSLTSFALAEIAGGQVTFGTAPTTMRVTGTSRNIVSLSAGAITTLDIFDRSVVEYNSNGTITTLQVYGPDGLFDGTGNRHPGTVTITTAIAYYGGLIDLRNGSDNWVLTNGVRSRGGRLEPPYGSVVNITS